MTSWPEPRGRTTLRLAPFRGVRYTPHAGDPADLMFTPPTSWSSAPDSLRSGVHPHHILRLLAPAFDDDPSTGAALARSTLREWLDSGVLRPDDVPALYVYEQPGAGDHVRGVIGTVDHATSSDAFLDHEEIIADLVAVQRTLEQTMHAHVEPILALHHGADGLRSVLDEITATTPELTISDAETGVHRLWRVADPTRCAAITAAIPEGPYLIADGHHRHAAWRHDALTLLTDVEQPGLRLGAIHRVVAGLDPGAVVTSPLLTTEPLPDRAAALRYLDNGPDARSVVYAAGRFHATTPAVPSAQCAAPELAVCHLHSHWLPQWNATEADVDYVHDVDTAIGLAGDDRIAVLLPTPTMREVVAAARDRRPLPRKATSFRPKPLVGTVLNVWKS